MPDLPNGTVTFLFTDIEGSTRLWEQHPEAMRPALARHDALLRQAIAENRGCVFKTVGDAFCAAFATAPDALTSALAAQEALTAEPWPAGAPIRVRMALHTGSAEERDGDYFGPPLNRVARLLAAGHGGQTLLSLAAQELTRDHLPEGASLRDLGERRLKDLARPERIFQLLHPALPLDFPPLRSLDNPALPNNLPQQPTSFVGREREMAEVRGLLEGTRLLTLAGPGGAGKTRLALQAAADLLDQYGDGVWLAELAPLSDPAQVPRAVADALGVPEEAGRPVSRTLAEWLRPKRLLLVLDNCEHVVAACAALVSNLLRACPDARVLVTSREPLNVAGEQTYRVPSLSLPDPKKAQTVTSLSQYEAVRLFIERARAVQPAFAVTDRNAPAVAQVCVHLDGIPLAIELAAARVRSLSAEEINARLDQRFRLLTGGGRDTLPRQQTLRALIDWSYDLLTGQERTLLGRLSVFAGGWTLEAAEAVCAGDAVEDWEVLDLLTGLADKSLVVAEDQEGRTRYRLLETIRQYAQHQLAEAGEEEGATRRRHRDFFLALADEADARMLGPEQGAWLRRLEVEHDNLRAVLDDCWADADGAEAGLRLAAALRVFWQLRGHVTEGRERLAAALAHGGAVDHPRRRARALSGAANLALRQSDLARAQALARELLTASEALGEATLTASALLMLGNAALIRGETAGARGYYERCLELYREAGDRGNAVNVLSNLGMVLEIQGDLAGAQAATQESLDHFREQGDAAGTAYALSRLGSLSWRRGEAAAARARLEQSLDISREIGMRDSDVAFSHLLLARAAAAVGDTDAVGASLAEALTLSRECGDLRMGILAIEAAGEFCLADGPAETAGRLLGAAAALRRTHALPLTEPDLSRVEADVARARESLGAARFEQAWAQGQALSWEQALGAALADAAGAPPG